MEKIGLYEESEAKDESDHTLVVPKPTCVDSGEKAPANHCGRVETTLIYVWSKTSLYPAVDANRDIAEYRQYDSCLLPMRTWCVMRIEIMPKDFLYITSINSIEIIIVQEPKPPRPRVSLAFRTIYYRTSALQQSLQRIQRLTAYIVSKVFTPSFNSPFVSKLPSPTCCFHFGST